MTSQHPPSSRLQADGVRLAYDDVVVVDDLDLQVPDGQITVIVGPNACGKSTLLRSLARLLKPSAGRGLLDGDLIHSMPTKEPLSGSMIASGKLLGKSRKAWRYVCHAAFASSVMG